MYRLQEFSGRSVLLVAILTLLLGSEPVVGVDRPQKAQPTTAPAPQDKPVTLEKIEGARKATESDTTLTEPDKKKALELLDQAKKWLQEAETAKAELARVDKLVKEAPRRVEQIRAQLASPPSDEALVKPAVETSNLEQIELAVSQEELELTQRRESLSKQGDELSRLLVGAKGLSEEIASRTKSIEQIDEDLKSQSADEPAVITRARELALKARRLLRKIELDTVKLRLGSLNLLTKLAQAERDLSAAEVARRQPRLDSLKQLAQQLREERAKGAREEAEALRASTAALPAALQKIAEENASYREELEGLIQQEKAVSEQLALARRGLDEIKADFARTGERVDVVGASEAIVKMLQRRRDALPSVQKYQRTSNVRAAEISRATDRQIELDELQRELVSIGEVVARVLADLPDPKEAERLEPEVYALAQTRRAALNELQTVYSRYVGQLTALDLAERQLVEVSESFVDYIDDQLMWMPSTGLASLRKSDATLEGFGWLFDPSNWQQLVKDGIQFLRERPVLAVLFLAAYVSLIASRRHAPAKFSEISQETRKIRTDSFRLTAKAIWYTAAMALPWPVLMVAIGWALGELTTADRFTEAIAGALFNTGLMFGSLAFYRQACRPDNLGDSHLRWPEPIRNDLLLQLRWFIPLAVSLGFLVSATSRSDAPAVTQGLGWVVFMLLMGGTAFLAARLLRRGGAMMSFVLEGRGGSWLAELHFLWFPLAVGIPVALALTSALGYHLTALRLEHLFQMTLWLFIGLFLLKELLLRALYIAERRLRLEDALKRREELRAQRAHAEEDAAEDQGPASPLDIPEVPEVDFNELSDQTKRLVSAGFLFGAVIGTWAIWNDLLPALGFLNETALPFDTTRIVDGVAKQVPVTMGNLAVGLIIVIITVLAAKNLPGLLEITLLQRLPLDPGARYAITSLSQYSIAGIGIFSAFGSIGLEWSKLQWLVAALGVGLGFGLQEIVANFISGIILLFERPIRVGDVVTVDQTTGVVSRIRIRATTITNWDKQELLVPNKQFITSQLINWTLSNKMNRIVITVGIAYGSDVDRAMNLMTEAAAENENILEDPKPIVSFEAFGDNALTLLLRAYLGSMDYRLATITAMHQAINRKFNAAGIEIAFPQRDLHLDTVKPLEININRVREGLRPSA